MNLIIHKKSGVDSEGDRTRAPSAAAALAASLDLGFTMTKSEVRP